ncbi:MAG: 5'/3'-nucleotidase SurE [Pirellulaceae bacterium]
MKIIITNDDSVMAMGIRALANYLSVEHELFVVAPDNERSGVSQSITYRRPFFAKKFPIGPAVTGWGVNGYPVDCVKIALAELCPFQPDLVVSGINNGLNVARNVAHSGTVAGALAGSAAGIPALALSMEASENEDDFVRAIEIAWPICEAMVTDPMAKGKTLNVNVPLAALNGNPEFHVVPANPNPMGNRFLLGKDPNGRTYYWQTNEPSPEPMTCLSDVEIVTRGDISITPLTHDMTLYHELDHWSEQVKTKMSSQ